MDLTNCHKVPTLIWSSSIIIDGTRIFIFLKRYSFMCFPMFGYPKIPSVCGVHIWELPIPNKDNENIIPQNFQNSYEAMYWVVHGTTLLMN